MQDQPINVTHRVALSGSRHPLVLIALLVASALLLFHSPLHAADESQSDKVSILLQLALKRAPSRLITTRARCDAHAAQAEKEGSGVLHLLALARCFETGVGRPKLLLQAKDLFERAAKRGSATAHLALGQYHLDGRIVEKNHVLSASYFQFAAAGGLPEAMIEYGLVLWRSGHSKHVACDWFESAAKLNAPAGIRLLGDCHALGVGTRSNADRAGTLYRRASRLGDQTAQLKISGHVFRGAGSDIARTEGCEWASTAAARYNQAAATALAYCLSLATR